MVRRIYNPIQVAAGYYKVEWVCNNSTMLRINYGTDATGWINKVGDTVDMDFQVVQRKSQSYFWSGYHSSFYINTSAPYFGIVDGSYTSGSFSQTSDQTARTTCSLYTKKLSTNAPLLWGGIHSSNAGSPGIVKVYSFKVTRNNSVAYNFVPALRALDEVAGLFDTVQNRFYCEMYSSYSTSGPGNRGEDLTHGDIQYNLIIK